MCVCEEGQYLGVDVFKGVVDVAGYFSFQEEDITEMERVSVVLDLKDGPLEEGDGQSRSQVDFGHVFAVVEGCDSISEGALHEDHCE